MKTLVKTEEPAFVLKATNDTAYNDDDVVEVSWSTLHKAEVGQEWEAYRSSKDEYAKVVFKDEHGCAVLFTSSRYGEEDPPTLIWFAFTD